MLRDARVDAAVIRCQGCNEDREHIREIFDYGRTVYYCPACADIYIAWAASMKAEEARLQRSLDLLMEETRKSLPLAFCPIDLPPRQQGLDGMRLA